MYPDSDADADPDAGPDPAIAYYFLKVHLHHFSKIKSQKDVTKQ
jgi:hypothetical protein